MRVNKVLECMDYCFHVERNESEMAIAMGDMYMLRELIKQDVHFKSRSVSEVIVEVANNPVHYKKEINSDKITQIITLIERLGYIKKD